MERAEWQPYGRAPATPSPDERLPLSADDGGYCHPPAPPPSAPSGAPSAPLPRTARRALAHSHKMVFENMAPPSSSRGAAQSFCAAPDTRALFAVLGVVTHQQSSFRHSIRRTWLPSPEAGVVTRLVMRGFNASAAVIDEAAKFGDIIFLPSSASLSKDVGPLQSSWQWLECAISAWPRAALIGKAEDDVWVHLPGVLESLRAGSAALGKLDVHSLYWGNIETCNTHQSEPMMHACLQLPPRQRLGADRMCVAPVRLLECELSTARRLRLGTPPRISAGSQPALDSQPHPHAPQVWSVPNAKRLRPLPSRVRDGSEPLSSAKGFFAGSGCYAADQQRLPDLRGAVGPFPYAKGPLYFLSRDVVERLVKEQQPLLERALPTAGVRAGVGRSAGKAIWEDVWLGYALGQLDPPPELGIVAIDWSLFFENWGIGIRPASLVWHAKVKHAGRLELLQRWSEKHHCMRRRPQNLTCHNAGRSCTGGLWRMCLETNVPSVHNCSDTQADLKYLLVRGLLNSTSST